MPRQGKREGHRRVEMRSRNVAGGIDHHHDDQPKRSGNADMANRSAGNLVNGHRAATGKDNGKRTDEFSGAFSQ